MKNNRLALLITLGLLLIAGSLYFVKQRGLSLPADANFVIADTSSVTKIFIADLDTNHVLLERKANGWELNEKYKAQQRKVDELLATMQRVSVRAPVSKASHDNVITRMAGISVKVEMYQMLPRINLFGKIKLFPRETRSLVFYVGDAPKDNMGTFMLKEGAETAYIMQLTGFIGYLSTRFSPRTAEWRDHTVFKTKLNDIQTVKVEFNQQPNESFKVNRIGKHAYEFKMLKDNSSTAYDTLQILNFLTSFSDIRFEALLYNMPQKEIDSIVNTPFLHRITLRDVEGNDFTVTTFRKTRQDQYTVDDVHLQPEDLDRMFALVNNGRDFVLVQYFVFDKILRKASYFKFQ